MRQEAVAQNTTTTNQTILSPQMQNQTMTNQTQGGGATAAATTNLTLESVIYNLNEGSDLDY